MAATYEHLADFLDHLTGRHGLSVCIKPCIPLYSLDRNLAQTLYPYHLHENQYCLYVKSEPAMLARCNAMQDRIECRCRRSNAPFWGACHAGVTEYVIPVTDAQDTQTLIAFVCVGVFRTRKEDVHRAFRSMLRSSSLSGDRLAALYADTMLALNQSLRSVAEHVLAILGEYLRHLYSVLRYQDIGRFEDESRVFPRERNILLRILDYIYANYSTRIAVADIAGNCCCSDSLINHIFKKNMGTNIKTYINKVRIMQARQMLKESEYNVSEIAFRVGFEDSNYFSKVFSTLIGMSPHLYRKQAVAAQAATTEPRLALGRTFRQSLDEVLLKK